MRIFIVLLTLLIASPATAQVENCRFFATEIDALVAGQTNVDHAVRLLDVGQGARCFAIFMADATRIDRAAFVDFVRRFEGSRTDKQSGAGAKASGSTTVVTQGPAAKVLSVAAEYGAITQSVSGQVVTLRGNLAGIPSALVRHDVFPYCVGPDRNNAYCVDNSMLSLLRRVSFAVSFDANRGRQVTGTPLAAASAAGQPVTFTAGKNELSSASAHVELWNRRDTTSPAFRKAWAAKVGAAMDQTGSDLMARAGTFAETVLNASGHEAWRVKHLALVRAAGRNRAQIVAALDDALRELAPIVQTAVPTLHDQAQAALASYSTFFLDQDQFIDTLAVQKVVAIEYVNNRPAGQAATSNVRLVVDWPMNAETKLVANAAATFYGSSASEVAGVSRYRDAQLGVQLDRALGRYSILGPATVSIAGYYQYQHAPSLLTVDPLNPVPGITFIGLPANAKTVFADTGDIWLAQARLALTPPRSGVKVPVSVTYSNRTELIDKPTWRAQIGITYDFDSLFAGLSKP
jgi:hypothetical protein